MTASNPYPGSGQSPDPGGFPPYQSTPDAYPPQAPPAPQAFPPQAPPPGAFTPPPAPGAFPPQAPPPGAFQQPPPYPGAPQGAPSPYPASPYPAAATGQRNMLVFIGGILLIVLGGVGVILIVGVLAVIGTIAGGTGAYNSGFGAVVALAVVLVLVLSAGVILMLIDGIISVKNSANPQKTGAMFGLSITVGVLMLLSLLSNMSGSATQSGGIWYPLISLVAAILVIVGSRQLKSQLRP